MIPTTSLETSKKLKAAGFRQDTFFQWIFVHSAINSEYNHWELLDKEHPLYCKNAEIQYASFCSDELLSELPFKLRFQYDDYWFQIQKLKNGSYDVRYSDWQHMKVKKIFQDELLCEALSQMWLWLKSEGIIK